MSARRASMPCIVLAAAIDVIAVVVFAVSGRSSHAETLDVTGLWRTAWPFLAGLAIIWLVALVWRRPFAAWRAGLPLWIGTVALGMLFRTLSGQGTALPFVIVATLVLGLILLGWRLIAALVRMLLARRTAA